MSEPIVTSAYATLDGRIGLTDLTRWNPDLRRPRAELDVAHARALAADLIEVCDYLEHSRSGQARRQPG